MPFLGYHLAIQESFLGTRRKFRLSKDALLLAANIPELSGFHRIAFSRSTASNSGAALTHLEILTAFQEDVGSSGLLKFWEIPVETIAEDSKRLIRITVSDLQIQALIECLPNVIPVIETLDTEVLSTCLPFPVVYRSEGDIWSTEAFEAANPRVA